MGTPGIDHGLRGAQDCAVRPVNFSQNNILPREACRSGHACG